LRFETEERSITYVKKKERKEEIDIQNREIKSRKGGGCEEGGDKRL